MVNSYIKNLHSLHDQQKGWRHYYDTLFKYIDLDGGIKALEKSTIKFSNPNTFEDVSECKSLRLNTIISGESISKFFSKVNVNDSIKFSKKEINIDSAIDNFSNKLGICCLSTQKNNEFIWNFERIQHKGISIEYYTKPLIDWLKGERTKEEKGLGLISNKIIYLNKIEKVNYDIDEHILTTILNWIFVKESDRYKEEQEVRLVSNFEHPGGDHTFVEIPENLLKNVYIGKNVNNGDQSRIEKIIGEKYKGNVGIIKL